MTGQTTTSCSETYTYVKLETTSSNEDALKLEESSSQSDQQHHQQQQPNQQQQQLFHAYYGPRGNRFSAISDL